MLRAIVEVKFKGRWVTYSQPPIPPDYHGLADLLGTSQDARGTRIHYREGLPDDASELARVLTSPYVPCWLKKQAAAKAERRYEQLMSTPLRGKPQDLVPLFGLVFGDPIYGYVANPDDYDWAKEAGFTDVRVILYTN